MTEGFAFLVFLSDERFESTSTLSCTSKLPVEISSLGSDNWVGLGMLECCKLFGSELCTKFSVLRLLQVGKEVLLCLSVLVVAILLRVHGQFKEFLVILTAVEKVCINFGKPEQKALSTMTVDEANKYMAEGHFAPGSMLPKVEAAVKFVMSKPGRKAIITSLDKAVEALEGKSGTTIA